jgi:hypothetical protein
MDQNKNTVTGSINRPKPLKIRRTMRAKAAIPDRPRFLMKFRGPQALAYRLRNRQFP